VESKDIERVLAQIPTYAEELGLDLRCAKDRFKWFLASILFAKRISAEIAKRTYRVFEERGLTTPEAILEAGWESLVEALDEGGYVRYDFSTADRLLDICEKLLSKYGSIDAVHQRAKDAQDLERRLLEFKGVGPTAVSIFLRELRRIWEKARPQVSQYAVCVGRKLGLGEEAIERYESQLVRIHLEYCKRGRCSKCPVRAFCTEARGR